MLSCLSEKNYQLYFLHMNFVLRIYSFDLDKDNSKCICSVRYSYAIAFIVFFFDLTVTPFYIMCISSGSDAALFQ